MDATQFRTIGAALVIVLALIQAVWWNPLGFNVLTGIGLTVGGLGAIWFAPDAVPDWFREE